MLDLVLVLVAALCQVALAWIGIHVSEKPISRYDKKRSRRIRWSFFGIAAIGIFAIATGGYRSANVQSEIANGVNSSWED